MARDQRNKAHKSRFASKSSRREHQVGNTKDRPGKKNAPTQSGKEIRLQRSKDIRDQKRAALLAEKRKIKGEQSAPRVLALVPLSSRAQTSSLKQRILAACTSEPSSSSDDMKIIFSGINTASIPKHNFRLTVLEAPVDDLPATLQVTKVADIIAFVISGGNGEEYIDQSGKTLLSMLKSQGLPNTITVILGLEEVATKRRSELKKLIVDCLEADLPPQTKPFNGDNNEDSEQILRYISEQRPSHIQWRSQRPFVMAEEISFDRDSISSGTLLVSGYLREKSLSVNQLVHVSGVGDFQLAKIVVLNDPTPLYRSANNMEEDVHKEFIPDESKQEELVVENTPDPLAGEQTWPTEKELALAERNAKTLRKRKLPKGTSTYQAAWIVDDEYNEDESDDDAYETADMECDDDERAEEAEEAAAEFDDGQTIDDDTNTMMEDDAEEDVKRLKDELKDDEEFPDEVDTPLDVPARHRFARYRGLKSFRTSPWDPKESLPQDYSRIFAFDNFNKTMKLVVKGAQDKDNLSVPAGAYVKLYVKNFPRANAEHLLKTYQTCPVVAVGLLKHESKMSVLHFGLRKYDDLSDPVKSKDNLVFHTGFRSYLTSPIFSTDDLNANKHKYERFLHPGRFSVASVYMPVQFPPAPLIVFKSDEAGKLHYAASGSLRTVDPDRIVLKRIVLSGYPMRVSKRKAVVRYMFYDPEDIKWFKPLEVWTKYGRRGRIMEPVGTHGAMKCVFDGVVQQRDAACISLYKRVYPKWPENVAL